MFDEGFIFLFGLIALFYLIGIPVLVLILFTRNRRLVARISTLEDLARSSQISPKADAAGITPEPIRRDETEPLPALADTVSGPWSTASQQRNGPSGVVEPPKTPGFVQTAMSALRDNWVYVISALSLALAGVFLVQYGAEHGLLPPSARVMAALIFGVVLIAAGEWLRRKSGDEGATATRHLPSVFAGAGVVSLFGATLAARQLYDLVSPGVAFGGFGAITCVAVLLGWFYGPFLAAIGLIGGFAAPFILGGTSDTPQTLLLYFALLAGLGLCIDTIRRWAWVSGLTMVLALGAATLLWVVSMSIAPWLTLYVAALALLATAIPARSFWPDHPGRTLLHTVLRRRRSGRPVFPVWLATATLLAATALILLVNSTEYRAFWLAYAVLTTLIVIFTVWSKNAPALQDLPLIPVAGALMFIGLDDTGLSARAAFHAERLPEANLPLDMVWLLGPAGVATLCFGWRSSHSRRFAALWAVATALYLPAVGLVIEYRWTPVKSIGPYPWALHAIAAAAVMVFLAERFMRSDGPKRTRAALATMSALATIAFTISILFTDAALTIAFAAVLLSAAALDHRFKLPLMEWFVLAATTALSYRLVFDPGLPWTVQGNGTAPLLAQAVATVACALGHRLLRNMDRAKAKLTLESAAWGFGGIFLCTAMAFGIKAASPTTHLLGTHWGLGLSATVWTLLVMVQIWRLETIKALRTPRICLTAVFALVAASSLTNQMLLANPLLSDNNVLGLPVLNTLIPAFLVPATLIGFAAWRLPSLAKLLRITLVALATTLAGYWVFLTLRHIWRGAEGMVLSTGFSQPELYSYTLALLITGGALFYQSLARQSDVLRRAGLAVIAIAIAKVFLIDISGLTGLIRVFSLLALGLMLAGMAWIDRWAQSRRAR